MLIHKLENPFLVSPLSHQHYKEAKGDLIPFLYTEQLTFCIGISFSLKNEKDQISKIGLYHSASEHSENTEEDVQKYLSQKTLEGRSADLIRAVNRFISDAKKPADVTITLQFNKLYFDSYKLDTLLVYNLIANVWNMRHPDNKIKIVDDVDDCKAFNFKTRTIESSNFCILNTGFVGDSLKDASSKEKEMVAAAILDFLAKKFIESWRPRKIKFKFPVEINEEKLATSFKEKALELISKVREQKISAYSACHELFKLTESNQSKLSQKINEYFRDFDTVDVLQLTSPVMTDSDKEKKEFKKF